MLHIRALSKPLSSVLRFSYSTASVATERQIGFGYTNEQLENAKPFKKMPGPNILQSLQLMADLTPERLADRYALMSEVYDNYGDISRIWLPVFGWCVSVLDPHDFEIVYRNEGRYPQRAVDYHMNKYRERRKQSKGLLLSNGEEWWIFRQPLNKGMMKANAAFPYLSTQTPVADDLVNNLYTSIERLGTGARPTIMQDIFRYALESVCVVVFDQRLGCMDPDLKADSWQQEFIIHVHAVFQALFKFPIRPQHKLYDKVGFQSKLVRSFYEGMDFITETSLRLVNENKERWKDIPESELKKRFLPQLLNIESLSTEAKMSFIFDMMFAAVDTTTYATLRTLFFLAKNPQIQETLFEEINLTNTDQSTIKFSKMHFLRAVIKETQRMKPVVNVITRQLEHDIVIKGYRIPEGTTMFIEHEFASNSFLFVNDPECFKPERWIRSRRDEVDEKERMHPFLSLPFGFGPRMCVGKRFAEQELNIVIVNLVKNFRIEYKGDKFPLLGLGLDKLPVKLDFVFTPR